MPGAEADGRRPANAEARPPVGPDPGAGQRHVRQAGRNVALIVMGVARRPGDELIFGETTSGVLQRCPCPVVLVSDARLRRDDEGREALRSGTG
ncbi:MAG: universal stress protein [Mesorhizobium sp.]|nr:MAG: universal stress protein [Mesorhizobium sp.]